MNVKKKEYTGMCIREMTELMHVRGVGRALSPKIKEWLKDVGGNRVDEYDRMGHKYYKQLYTDPIKKGPPRCWFEILECGSQNWEIFAMLPGSIPRNQYHEILPRDIIEEMVEDLVDPDNVVSKKKIRSAYLDKTMDIEYVYISSTLIVGTVTEHNQETTYRKNNIEKAFRLYYDYRNRFPKEVTTFERALLDQWGPDGSPDFKPAPANTEDAVHWEKFSPRPKPLLWENEPVPDFNGPVTVNMKSEDRKDINIGFLQKLAAIPEFNKWLWLKLEEIKTGPLKEQIDAYKATKAYYRETLLSDRIKEDPPTDGKEPPYWFMITYFSESRWEITELDPFPPVFESAELLLPLMLCRVMFDSKINPGTVYTMSTQLPPPLNSRKDLQWVRYSSNCVMGKVYETDISRVAVPGSYYIFPDNVPIIENISLHRRLLKHMYRNPAAAEALIDIFMKKLLPKLQ